MDNRETQAIEKMEGTKERHKPQRKWKGQSRMDNRETQAIEKMEETIKNGQQRDTSNRENGGDNQEWTIERHK